MRIDPAKALKVLFGGPKEREAVMTDVAEKEVRRLFRRKQKEEKREPKNR